MRTRHENRKGESNDSPEIPDRSEEITHPQPPFRELNMRNNPLAVKKKRPNSRRNPWRHITYPLFRDWASACTTFIISLQALEQASGDPLIVTSWKRDYHQWWYTTKEPRKHKHNPLPYYLPAMCKMRKTPQNKHGRPNKHTIHDMLRCTNKLTPTEQNVSREQIASPFSSSNGTFFWGVDSKDVNTDTHTTSALLCSV